MMSRRSVVAALVTFVAACVMVTAPSGAAQAATSITEGAPIGGPLHAEMYPSGLETSPNGLSVVVADTGNNQVARYSTTTGEQLWRVGTVGSGVNQFENPRDIAIDASNNVYVSDTRNSRIVKLSPSGTWLGETRGVGNGFPGNGFSFQLGVSIADGNIYVADTGRDRVVVMDLAFNFVREVKADGIAGSPCQSINDLRDVDADSNGNIYVATYEVNKIVKFSANGSCLTAWGGKGSTDGTFRTTYGIDLAVDPVRNEELVYVADALNNRVQVFTKSGQFVTKFGSFGEPDQEGTFTTMRRVAVAQDGSGDVWAADLWGNRIERWDRTSTGFTYSTTVGAVMPPPTNDAAFHEARGMAFDTSGKLWVADTVHHSFERFDPATGNLLGVCGQRAAEGSNPGQFNWPRGIAIDNATGNLWVADTKQHQLQVLSSSCQPLGSTLADWKVGSGRASAEVGSFNWPYDVAIRQSDRVAFIADTQNHRVQAFDVATKTVIAAFGARGNGAGQFQFPSAITVGPDGSVYVADRGNNRIQKLSFNGSTFTSLARYPLPLVAACSGVGCGPEGVAVDSYGRMIVADSENDRVVVLSPAGGVAATYDGGGTPFNHPAAVEVGPDGKVYVADTYNDVVRVLTIGPPPAPDTTAPTVTLAVPTPGQSFPLGTVAISGSATDNAGVTTVNVAIKRTADSLWLQPNGTWGTFKNLAATLASPGATSTGWTFSFTPPATGGYYVQSKAIDGAGLSSAVKSATFSVADQADGAPPTVAVTSPSVGASVTSPVLVAGTASDDTKVASVKVGIQRSSDKKWWNGTTWQTTFATVNAALANPNSSNTSWSYSFAASAGGYGYTVTVIDGAGKSTKTTWRTFVIS